MTDYQSVQNELKRAEKNIREGFAKLNSCDYQRMEHLHDYLKKRRAEDLGRFLKETLSSNALLRNIMKDFHGILKRAFLIEKEKHKYPHFREMLKRARYMEELLGRTLKERRTQISACRGILAPKGLLRKISSISRAVHLVQEKRLILAFGKEKNIVVLLAGFFKHERERINAAFQAYENEKKKKFPPAAASLTLRVIVPAVGTALGLVMHEAMQWAGLYSSNYKKMRDTKHGESNGAAI